MIDVEVPESQRRRDREAEGLRRAKVDDERELRGLFDGKVTRPGPILSGVNVGDRFG